MLIDLLSGVLNRHEGVKAFGSKVIVITATTNSDYRIMEFVEWIDTVPMTHERCMVDISCRKN